MKNIFVRFRPIIIAMFLLLLMPKLSFAEEYTKVFEVSTNDEIQDAVEEICNSADGNFLIKLNADIELGKSKVKDFVSSLYFTKNTTTIWGQGHKLTQDGSIENKPIITINTSYTRNKGPVNVIFGKEDGSDNLTISGKGRKEGIGSALVSVNDNGNLTMYDGVIIEDNNINTSTGCSGVYLSGGNKKKNIPAGNFTMNGGEIRNNTAVIDGIYPSRAGGAGVHVWAGTFIMNGGKITGNRVESIDGNRNAHGGGVMLLDMDVEVGKGTSKFIMNGGEISGNFATDRGGGIWAQKDTIVELNGGSIIDNKSGDGGAIFAVPFTYDDSNKLENQLNMTYDQKEDISADGKYGMLTISDQVVFKGNIATNGFSMPPENADEFSNLKFASTSVDDIDAIKEKSLLNNNDINYMSPLINVIYDANGGNKNFEDFVLPDKDADGKYIGKKDYEIKSAESLGIKRADFEFLGWSKDKNATKPDEEYAPGEKIDLKENLHLYAVWKDAPIVDEKMFLTLDENYRGGKVNAYAFERGTRLEKYLYTPHRDGYVFTGWNTDKYGEGKFVNENFELTYDMTLYAIWREENAIPGWLVFENDVKKDVKIEEKTETEIHGAYIKGYPDKTIRPSENMTRAEAITLVARLEQYDLSDYSDTVFADTDQSGWYNGAINAAYERGLLYEKAGENLRPDEFITRAEFAELLRHIDVENEKIAPFEDIIGHKFERAINQAYGNGRINGYPDGTFKPDDFITRAEIVAIMNRKYNRAVDEKGLMENYKVLIEDFDDLDEKWYYYEMIEASNTHEFTRRNKKDAQGNDLESWTKILNK